MNVMKDHSSLATAESRHNYEINVYLRNGPCDQRFRGAGFASALIKMIGCRPDFPVNLSTPTLFHFPIAIVPTE
jgi:hypothetical protein